MFGAMAFVRCTSGLDRYLLRQQAGANRARTISFGDVRSVGQTTPMTATSDEIAALRAEFERSHRRPARALAELLLLGNVILEERQLLEGKTGDAFEQFVLQSLSDQGVEVGEFAAALKALGALRATLAELQQLPD